MVLLTVTLTDAQNSLVYFALSYFGNFDKSMCFFRARQIRGQVDDLEAEIVKGELFSYSKDI